MGQVGWLETLVSNFDKILMVGVLFFMSMVVCVYYKNRCAPDWCRVCSFITLEYVEFKSLKDKIPDDL